MSNSEKDSKPKAPKVRLRQTSGSKRAPLIGVGGQALPPLPRAKRAKKTVPKDCECGCGGETRGGRFIPGHDSKLKAWTLRVERGLMKVSDIEHEGTRNAVKRAMKLGPVSGEKKPAKLDKPAAKSRKPRLKTNGGVKQPKPKRADDAPPEVADAPGSDYDLNEDVGDEDIH